MLPKYIIELYDRIISHNYITESYDRIMLRKYAAELYYDDRLRHTYDATYITTDILQQIYYGIYSMADILR